MLPAIWGAIVRMTFFPEASEETLWEQSAKGVRSHSTCPSGSPTYPLLLPSTHTHTHARTHTHSHTHIQMQLFYIRIAVLVCSGNEKYHRWGDLGMTAIDFSQLLWLAGLLIQTWPSSARTWQEGLSGASFTRARIPSTGLCPHDESPPKVSLQTPSR